jgi:small ligand-binding sensory domain FIST
MLVGTGTSVNTNSEIAGREAAANAMAAMETGDTPGFAIAFCSGRHNETEVLRAVENTLQIDDVIGGAAPGIITNAVLSYFEFECSVAVFPKRLGAPEIIIETYEGDTERSAGIRLGRRLAALSHDGQSVLLFYDSLKSSPPPELYVGSYLMDGIYEGLGARNVNIIGAGVLADMLKRSFIFGNGKVMKHAVLACLLPRSLNIVSTTMHGCVPASPYMKVTKIEGSILYELDGMPALEVVKQHLPEMTDISENKVALSVTIGENHGDKFGDFKEEDYVNRLVMSANPEDGSLTLFEADFEVGSEVQIMSRDNELMLKSVSRGTDKLLDGLGDRDVLLATYIDCLGRTGAFNGCPEEEAELVRQRVGEKLPLFGLYSGVEIAPLLGKSRPLDWTGVLSVISMEPLVEAEVNA